MTNQSERTRVRLGYFSRSIVLRVGRDRGYFEEAGLEILDEPVPSSPAQFRALLAGEYDLVLTSPDNVAAYRLSESNPLGLRSDVRMLLGIDRGLGLSIMSTSAVRDIEDIRGRAVAVDVPQSGFALAMFRVLQQRGLRRDEDFSVVSLGSTPGRADSLIAGKCEVTLLNAGHDIRAELAGCRRLLRIAEVLSPYIGTVLAATGPWLAENMGVTQRFVDSWRRATAVVLDNTNKQEMMQLLADELRLDGTGPELAYQTLLDDREGLIPDSRIDIPGLQTILQTRAKASGSEAGIDTTAEGIASAGLIDNRFLT